MAMTPFAMSFFGIDQRQRSRRTGASREADSTTGTAAPDASQEPSSRSSRRLTSHYNSFQTSCSPSDDAPPSYTCATRQRPAMPSAQSDGREKLPAYDCTVAAQTKLLLRLESVNPLHEATESDWKEVWVILRGTLLSFHRLKDGGPGKLLRSYTLQHAEVGLASDTQHSILVPQSRIAHLVPVAARKKAWRKDPDLFRPVRQSILRLRVETDQILLAHAEESTIHSLIYALAASIDISMPIDERSIPRQCTVPRRRRRPRQTNAADDLADPALLIEQERILREMYPAFAGQSDSTRERHADNRPVSLQVSAGEEDELDLALMQEATNSSTASALAANSNELSIRPTTTRQLTSSTIESNYSQDMLYATSPANFAADGKWQPQNNRSAAQIQRYMRRCMPVLYADAPRASDILICSGRRVRINWRMEVLEDWELRPPTYKAHKFDPVIIGLVRTRSQTSTTASVGADNSLPSSGSLLSQDDITPAQACTSTTNLDLTKCPSATTDKVGRVDSQIKRLRSPRHVDPNVHGVVFCF